jgi:hypothetical protein
MNKQFILNCTYLAALMLPLSSHAVIYKHVDENGRITYSNVKIKGGKRIKLEPADTSFGTNSRSEPKTKPTSKNATPNEFPKVDANTQKNRDHSRKQILLSELESEKKALEAAKSAYDEGAKNPEVFRKKNADGSSSSFRNVAKYKEKMKRLQSDVDVHKRNVALLEKEISNIN